MTMSVGLAKIQNDPNASIIVRKALGALSTPGLLVYDDALSIDDTGRIVLKLKQGGGLLQDSDGLHLEVTVGIDSHVDLVSDQYDRDWNARLTGTAPNFIESSVAIGSEELAGLSDAVTALGLYIEAAKVNITSSTTQLRLSYDQRNFSGTRVSPSGYQEVFSVGSSPGFHFVSGNGLYEGSSGGVRINSGCEVQTIQTGRMTTNFAGGGTAGNISWVEFNFALNTVYPHHSARPEKDHVSICPADGNSIPSEWICYSVRISALNELSVRIVWLGVTPGDVRDWIFLLHRLEA